MGYVSHPRDLLVVVTIIHLLANQTVWSQQSNSVLVESTGLSLPEASPSSNGDEPFTSADQTPTSIYGSGAGTHVAASTEKVIEGHQFPWLIYGSAVDPIHLMQEMNRDVDASILQPPWQLMSRNAASSPTRLYQAPDDLIRLGGWVNAGYTGNGDKPANNRNTPLRFNDRDDRLQLNQLSFFGEITVDDSGEVWDWGGRVDVVYGSDARFITSRGLELKQNGDNAWNRENSLHQIAIPQAYATFAVPFQKGLVLYAGRFYSFAGYETFASPDNFFYSRSYTYSYGEPLTHTGVQAAYRWSDDSALMLGLAQGWNIFSSNADTYTGILGWTWRNRASGSALSLFYHPGMDLSGISDAGVTRTEPRQHYSFVWQQDLTDSLQYVLQHDFGQQEDSRVDVYPATMTILLEPSQWYSLNQYLLYRWNRHWSAGLRFEWFRDEDSTRLGMPIVYHPGGQLFTGNNYYALTAGLNWTLLPNIRMRNELRWDSSDLQSNPNVPSGATGLKAFNDRTDSDQITGAIDLIIQF